MSRQYLTEIPDYTPTTEWCEGDDRNPGWEKQTEEYKVLTDELWALWALAHSHLWR